MKLEFRRSYRVEFCAAQRFLYGCTCSNEVVGIAHAAAGDNFECGEFLGGKLAP